MRNNILAQSVVVILPMEPQHTTRYILAFFSRPACLPDARTVLLYARKPTVCLSYAAGIGAAADKESENKL